MVAAAVYPRGGQVNTDSSVCPGVRGTLRQPDTPFHVKRNWGLGPTVFAL